MPSPDLTSEILPEFTLRCRDAQWLDQPPVVAEFNRSAPPLDRYAPLAELLAADLFARAHYKISSFAEGRMIISCETPRYGIPLGVRDLGTPPVADWLIRAVVTGDLLDAGPDGRLERSLATQLRRGLIAVAGALPLLVSPMLAYAGGPTQGAAAMQLEQALAGFAPPKLPDDGPGSVQAPPEAAPAPAPAPAPTTTAAPQLDPVAVPPPRLTNESLGLTGTAVWTGLLGKRVRLAMKNDQTLEGTIIAQSTSDLAIARASDGQVVSVPKRDVAGVGLSMVEFGPVDRGGSGVPLGDRPLENGRGAYAGGVVMVVLGSVLALSGTVFLAITPYYLFISLPQLVPGLAIVGGGAGLMVAGSKKKKAYNKAWGITAGKVQMTPTLSGTRNGGQAGLVLRF